nr:uncharacterized protein LOC109622638 [Aedes albopictus]
MSKLAARVLRKNEKKKFSSKNKVKLGSSDEFCYKIVLNKANRTTRNMLDTEEQCFHKSRKRQVVVSLEMQNDFPRCRPPTHRSSALPDARCVRCGVQLEGVFVDHVRMHHSSHHQHPDKCWHKSKMVRRWDQV